jgi:hypothetical protein
MTERPASPEYLRDLLVGHIPVQLACAMAGLRLADLDEYERLLGDSGFALEQAIPLPSSFSILDFRPQ